MKYEFHEVYMTRLDRIFEVFNAYDDLVQELTLENGNNDQNRALEKIRYKVKILSWELKKFGCRRAY